MLWINYILIKESHRCSKKKHMGLEKGYDSASLWAFLLSSVFTCQMALFQVSESSCALSLQEICKYSGYFLINKISVIPKKGNARECSNYWTIALISHASRVMLKILQARLQQNQELPDVQGRFRKAEEPEIKWPTSVGSLKNQESSRKTSTSASLTMLKTLRGSQQTVENF